MRQRRSSSLSVRQTLLDGPPPPVIASAADYIECVGDDRPVDAAWVSHVVRVSDDYVNHVIGGAACNRPPRKTGPYKRATRNASNLDDYEYAFVGSKHGWWAIERLGPDGHDILTHG